MTKKKTSIQPAWKTEPQCRNNETERSKVDLTRVLNTNKFDMNEAAENPVVSRGTGAHTQKQKSMAFPASCLNQKAVSP